MNDKNATRIVATYGDGTSAEFPSLLEAEERIGETLNGCDLAINVEYIKGYNAAGEHVCNFDCSMVCKLSPTMAL